MKTRHGGHPPTPRPSRMPVADWHACERCGKPFADERRQPQRLCPGCAHDVLVERERMERMERTETNE